MKVATFVLIGRRRGVVEPEKPHIWFEKGYWRVSPKPKPYHGNAFLFNKAHIFINMLNFKLHKR